MGSVRRDIRMEAPDFSALSPALDGPQPHRKSGALSSPGAVAVSPVDFGTCLIGHRLSIGWQDRSYSGRITAVNSARQYPYLVAYDRGNTELVKLDLEKMEWETKKLGPSKFEWLPELARRRRGLLSTRHTSEPRKRRNVRVRAAVVKEEEDEYPIKSSRVGDEYQAVDPPLTRIPCREDDLLGGERVMIKDEDVHVNLFFSRSGMASRASWFLKYSPKTNVKLATRMYDGTDDDVKPRTRGAIEKVILQPLAGKGASCLAQRALSIYYLEKWYPARIALVHESRELPFFVQYETGQGEWISLELSTMKWHQLPKHKPAPFKWIGESDKHLGTRRTRRTRSKGSNTSKIENRERKKKKPRKVKCKPKEPRKVKSKTKLPPSRTVSRTKRRKKGRPSQKQKQLNTNLDKAKVIKGVGDHSPLRVDLTILVSDSESEMVEHTDTVEYQTLDKDIREETNQVTTVTRFSTNHTPSRAALSSPTTIHLGSTPPKPEPRVETETSAGLTLRTYNTRPRPASSPHNTRPRPALSPHNTRPKPASSPHNTRPKPASSPDNTRAPNSCPVQSQETLYTRSNLPTIASLARAAAFRAMVEADRLLEGRGKVNPRTKKTSTGRRVQCLSSLSSPRSPMSAPARLSSLTSTVSRLPKPTLARARSVPIR